MTQAKNNEIVQSFTAKELELLALLCGLSILTESQYDGFISEIDANSSAVVRKPSRWDSFIKTPSPRFYSFTEEELEDFEELCRLATTEGLDSAILVGFIIRTNSNVRNGFKKVQKLFARKKKVV